MYIYVCVYFHLYIIGVVPNSTRRLRFYTERTNTPFLDTIIPIFNCGIKFLCGCFHLSFMAVGPGPSAVVLYVAFVRQTSLVLFLRPLQVAEATTTTTTTVADSWTCPPVGGLSAGSRASLRVVPLCGRRDCLLGAQLHPIRAGCSDSSWSNRWRCIGCPELAAT